MVFVASNPRPYGRGYLLTPASGGPKPSRLIMIPFGCGPTAPGPLWLKNLSTTKDTKDTMQKTIQA
jgi:hypothetical protein